MLGALNVGVASATDVSPIVDCIATNPSTGTLWAYFGYANMSVPTSIPFGEANQIVPGIQFQGQPTVFNTAIYQHVFRATFNQNAFEDIAWELNGEAALVSVQSPKCSASQTGAVSNLTPTTATLHGSVTPDGTATVSDFEYGTSTGYWLEHRTGDAGRVHPAARFRGNHRPDSRHDLPLPPRRFRSV